MPTVCRHHVCANTIILWHDENGPRREWPHFGAAEPHGVASFVQPLIVNDPELFELPTALPLCAPMFA